MVVMALQGMGGLEVTAVLAALPAPLRDRYRVGVAPAGWGFVVVGLLLGVVVAAAADIPRRRIRREPSRLAVVLPSWLAAAVQEATPAVSMGVPEPGGK
jgi:hypothetical protein